MLLYLVPLIVTRSRNFFFFFFLSDQRISLNKLVPDLFWSFYFDHFYLLEKIDSEHASKIAEREIKFLFWSLSFYLLEKTYSQRTSQSYKLNEVLQISVFCSCLVCLNTCCLSLLVVIGTKVDGSSHRSLNLQVSWPMALNKELIWTALKQPSGQMVWVLCSSHKNWLHIRSVWATSQLYAYN